MLPILGAIGGVIGFGFLGLIAHKVIERFRERGRENTKGAEARTIAEQLPGAFVHALKKGWRGLKGVAKGSLHVSEKGLRGIGKGAIHVGKLATYVKARFNQMIYGRLEKTAVVIAAKHKMNKVIDGLLREETEGNLRRVNIAAYLEKVEKMLDSISDPAEQRAVLKTLLGAQIKATLALFHEFLDDGKQEEKELAALHQIDEMTKLILKAETEKDHILKYSEHALKLLDKDEISRLVKVERLLEEKKKELQLALANSRHMTAEEKKHKQDEIRLLEQGLAQLKELQEFTHKLIKGVRKYDITALRAKAERELAYAKSEADILQSKEQLAKKIRDQAKALRQSQKEFAKAAEQSKEIETLIVAAQTGLDVFVPWIGLLKLNIFVFERIRTILERMVPETREQQTTENETRHLIKMMFWLSKSFEKVDEIETLALDEERRKGLEPLKKAEFVEEKVEKLMRREEGAAEHYLGQSAIEMEKTLHVVAGLRDRLEQEEEQFSKYHNNAKQLFGVLEGKIHAQNMRSQKQILHSTQAALDDVQSARRQERMAH